VQVLAAGHGSSTAFVVSGSIFVVGGVLTGVLLPSGVAAPPTGQPTAQRAMGAPFEGVITGSGLMYTTIDTPDGLISMPNAGLLAAAIGPAPEPNAPKPTAES